MYLVRNSAQVFSWTVPADTTVATSRNGHSAVLLWSFISQNPYDAQVSVVLECLRVVQYTVIEQLEMLQVKLNMDLWIVNVSPSLAVVFRQPNADLVEKYALSCTMVYINSHTSRHLSRIYIMPHVTTEKIDTLIKELCSPGAFEI